jgi:hypothetical protein
VDQGPNEHDADARSERRPDEVRPDALSEGDSTTPVARRSDGAPTRSDEPDVMLDVPSLKVDEISLEVEELQARVSLHASVGDLVKLDVGADVGIGKVKLCIKGVEARALLKVRLDYVHAILARALDTIDSNPQVLNSLLEPLGHTLEQVGGAGAETLSEVGRSAGKTIEETVPSVSRGVEETVREVREEVPGVARDVGGTLIETVPDVGGEVEVVKDAVGNVTSTSRDVAAGEPTVSQVRVVQRVPKRVPKSPLRAVNEPSRATTPRAPVRGEFEQPETSGTRRHRPRASQKSAAEGRRFDTSPPHVDVDVYAQDASESDDHDVSISRAALGRARNVVQLFGRTVRNASNTIRRRRRAR